MPRPKVTQISVPFPTDVADRIKAEAERRLVSPRWLVIKAVEQFLEPLPDPMEQIEAAGKTIKNIKAAAEREGVDLQ